MLLEDSRESKEEKRRHSKKKPLVYMLVHNPQKREEKYRYVDRVLVVMWKVNLQRAYSCVIKALFKAAIMESFVLRIRREFVAKPSYLK